MFRSLYWYTDTVISLLIGKILLVKANNIKKEQGEEEYQKYIHEGVTKWGKKRVEHSGSKVNISGIENIPDTNGILFVSNHQSNFDILALLGYLPKEKGFIAKKELSKIPVLSEWMTRINCLFLDRENLKQTAKIITEGIKYLKEGKNMVIFPEGTRSKGKPHRHFKGGSFKLATKSGAPIVPITIDGTYKIMEGNFLNAIKPANVNITIHKPIFVSELNEEEKTKLPKRVEDIVFGGLESENSGNDK